MDVIRNTTRDEGRLKLNDEKTENIVITKRGIRNSRNYLERWVSALLANSRIWIVLWLRQTMVEWSWEIDFGQETRAYRLWTGHWLTSCCSIFSRLEFIERVTNQCCCGTIKLRFWIFQIDENLGLKTRFLGKYADKYEATRTNTTRRNLKLFWLN